MNMGYNSFSLFLLLSYNLILFLSEDMSIDAYWNLLTLTLLPIVLLLIFLNVLGLLKKNVYHLNVGHSTL